jgi:hypothetical protein
MNGSSTEIALHALRGSGLLGFMAALGTLRTLSELPEGQNTRMQWTASGGSYCPILQCTPEFDESVLLDRLHAALSAFAGHAAITIDKDLKIARPVFRKLAQSAAADFLERKDAVAAGMTAAFGCDAIGKEDGTIEDTAFRTMSGAGHQHFLEFVNILAKETTIEQLKEAIFGPWRYRDPSPIMRWDSEDDRRYALRWDEPSKDPVRTVRGANRLAIAALPFFPVVPLAHNSVGTAGFKGRGSRDTFVTWPLWSGWLTLGAVRSCLGLPDLQSDTCTAASLSSRGILAIYRSQRITLGKYRNFTPTRSL